MSALRRVLPTAVAFVVVGGSVYSKTNRRWALVARGEACGRPGRWSGGLGRRPLVAVTPKPGDSVRISAVAGGGLVAWAVVRWWRLRRNRVIQ